MKDNLIFEKQADGNFKVDLKETAELETSGMAILDKIPKLEFAGVPVGDAAKAMVAAGVSDAVGVLALRFLPSSLTSNRYSNVALKVGTILLLNYKPVKNFMGATAVNGATLILTYEAVAGLFNLRTATYNMLSKITGKIGGTATATATATGSSSGDVIQTI